MKKIFALLFLIILSSCTSVRSIVSDSIKQPYKKPSFVILHTPDNKELAEKMKEGFTEMLSKDNIEPKVTLITGSKTNEINASERINRALKHSTYGSDIVFTLDPKLGHYQGNRLITIEYEVIGTDTKSKQEVWKANFITSHSFKISKQGKSSSAKMYEKLKSDKVL